MSEVSSVSALRVADEAFLVASTIERCPKTMMLRELVVNAIEAAGKADGERLVELTTRRIDGIAKLCIINTGPGLSAEELYRICDLASSLGKTTSLDGNFGMGAKVASDLCTIVDDGTLPNRRGSLSVDDEGVPTECTTLVSNGRLSGYMQDKHNARLMGVRPTGNGRRESFAHLPMPRMTNTYMLPGQSDPAEIIASVPRGLYAVNFGGGQVDITNGKFVFSASEAYLIENGKVTRPVKGATLIGSGPDVLMRVSMVGNDLKLDEGVGTCGKEGQSVPVGVGQPTLKIDAMTVGGTAA